MNKTIDNLDDFFAEVKSLENLSDDQEIMRLSQAVFFLGELLRFSLMLEDRHEDRLGELESMMMRLYNRVEDVELSKRVSKGEYK